MWHERLGHINSQLISVMISKNLVNGVDVNDKNEVFCDGCQYGKQHKLSFAKIKRRKAAICELVHSDLCGPMSVPSVCGAKNFIFLQGSQFIFSHNINAF